MFKYLFLNQIKRTRRYFLKKSIAKIITSVLFLLIFALISYGIYKFFELGFYFISADEQALSPLLLYFYEIFFIVLGAIIFFSGLVTGMFSLWRGKNDSWFVSAKNYKYLPRFVFIKNILSGIWPLFVVFLPVVLALNKVFDLSALGILSILFSFVFYLLLISSIALLFIVWTAHFFHAISKKFSIIKFTFGRLFSVLLFVVLVGFIFVWKNSLSIDFIELFRANYTDSPVVEMTSVSKHFNYLPSHLIAMNTINSQIGVGIEMIKYLLYLFFLSLLSIFAWWNSASFFLPIWQKLKEGNSIETGKGIKRKSVMSGFVFSGSSLNALFKKEYITSFRNPRNLIWFSFLLFIWLIQVSVNLTLGRSIVVNELDPSLRETAIQALQFVVATYFISAFVLRFVFPSFSSEAKTLWILSSSPINFAKIFYIKYFFYSLFFLILGLALGYLNMLGLKLDWVYVFETLLMFSIATLFIVAIGLSLGAIFPNYDTDDPGVVSTSLPGISLIVASLAYGTFGGYIIYLAEQANSSFLIYLFIAISGLLTALTILLTPKTINLKNKPKEIIS